MYTEGMADLNEMIQNFLICPPNEKDAKVTLVKERITTRYFPAFEKVSGHLGALRLAHKEKSYLGITEALPFTSREPS